MLWLLIPLGFLLGSAPFGLLLGKLKGVDIRDHGSGNIGSTNVFRTLGKKSGITCLILDLLKGFAPVLLAINLARIEDASFLFSIEFLKSLTETVPASQQFQVQSIHVLTALAAILGHNYSPWIGFKGGKGIATSGGALLALMPAAVILLVLIFIIVARITKYVSVGSIATGIALPLLTLYGSWYHGKIADGTWNKPLLIFSIVAGALAIWKHRSNISRLRAGTENKIGQKKEAKQS
ncbi:MAG: glycerol-3-phosphate 1-O-acyltransferase PlsY [Akkermansiaceae bacterium]|jgi:glycerol-3-phosphate acyltransferase PlsY|nr:glycerol-3-phosphate 1-O-acyltransferase PlsY [Akkermansiaceae bacterium]